MIQPWIEVIVEGVELNAVPREMYVYVRKASNRIIGNTNTVEEEVQTPIENWNESFRKVEEIEWV